MKNLRDLYLAVFGEELRREPYTYIPHAFLFNKIIGKNVCKKCGLVKLNNDFSQWSVQAGCMSNEHPRFEHARLKYTSLRQR